LASTQPALPPPTITISNNSVTLRRLFSLKCLSGL
jgi:hypothetical protein